MATIRFDPSHGVVVAEAMIRGPVASRKILVAIDTGAAYCVIPPEYALAIGIQPGLNPRMVSITTASGVLHVPVVEMPRIAVGPVEAQEVSCALHSLPASSRIDGLIGISFLRRFQVFLDFEAGVLKMEARPRKRV